MKYVKAYFKALGELTLFYIFAFLVVNLVFSNVIFLFYMLFLSAPIGALAGPIAVAINKKESE